VPGKVAAATRGRPGLLQTNIIKMKHFRWWNVFDGICRMGRWSFWSRFDVNRSIIVQYRSNVKWLRLIWATNVKLRCDSMSLQCKEVRHLFQSRGPAII